MAKTLAGLDNLPPVPGYLDALDLPGALAHLGVRHIDMPATPEQVWRAVSEARPS